MNRAHPLCGCSVLVHQAPEECGKPADHDHECRAPANTQHVLAGRLADDVLWEDGTGASLSAAAIVEALEHVGLALVRSRQ